MSSLGDHSSSRPVSKALRSLAPALDGRALLSRLGNVAASTGHGLIDDHLRRCVQPRLSVAQHHRIISGCRDVYVSTVNSTTYPANGGSPHYPANVGSPYYSYRGWAGKHRMRRNSVEDLGQLTNQQRSSSKPATHSATDNTGSST